MPSRRQLFKLPSRRVLLCCAFAAAAPAPPNTTTRVAQRQHEQLVHLHERKREEFLRRHNATAPCYMWNARAALSDFSLDNDDDGN